KRQQPLVSRRGLLLTTAITEQPGAEMGGIGIVWGRGEGAAAAFESVIAAPAVEQRLGQAAIQYSRGRMSASRISEEAQANVKLPGAERRRGGIEIDQERGSYRLRL